MSNKLFTNKRVASYNLLTQCRAVVNCWLKKNCKIKLERQLVKTCVLLDGNKIKILPMIPAFGLPFFSFSLTPEIMRS